MADLGGLTGQDGFDACERVVDEYESWIKLREDEIPELSSQDQPTGARHMSECASMLNRMQEGLEWLRSDQVAREAFELANRAILDQQLRSSLKVRSTSITKAQGHVVAGPHPSPDWKTDPRRGKWRPFQIGFLLAAARSAVLEGDPQRSHVDLIFFPTGGGKTEAYLGLAAFAMFYQRLADDEHPGVNVLMRYTLRLLTAQQFLRASSLICAMERIRLDHDALADAVPFSIGIWVGRSATPNKRQDAKAKLRELNRTPSAKNPFLLLQCPWCAAAMGPASKEATSHARAARPRTFELRDTWRGRVPSALPARPRLPFLKRRTSDLCR